MKLELICLKKNNKSFNIAGKLSLNEWKGQSNVEFIIDDISVNKTFKNTVPSSIGQDSWFSSNKEGFDSPWDRQYSMKKIAVIEKIHNDGLELLKRNKGY